MVIEDTISDRPWNLEKGIEWHNGDFCNQQSPALAE
jgi:hypothetical protein